MTTPETVKTICECTGGAGGLADLVAIGVIVWFFFFREKKD